MGAGASQSADDRGGSVYSTGLHVLRVTPGSPASATDIQPFFDFVVGIDGDEQSDINIHGLEKVVESHEGRTLSLKVYSSKSLMTRLVPIVPSRQWSSSGILPPNMKPSLLGLSMRVCQPTVALEHVWHILEILEGSPAESAGLVPYGDWIVGWSGGALSSEGDFYDIVETHIEKPLRVYVYSYDFDTLREVVLVPNRMWGGEGLLGCGVGYGLLHRIPHNRPEPSLLSEDEVHSAVDERYGYNAPQDWTLDQQHPEQYQQQGHFFTPGYDIAEEDEPEEQQTPQHSYNTHGYTNDVFQDHEPALETVQEQSDGDEEEDEELRTAHAHPPPVLINGPATLTGADIPERNASRTPVPLPRPHPAHPLTINRSSMISPGLSTSLHRLSLDMPRFSTASPVLGAFRRPSQTSMLLLDGRAKDEDAGSVDESPVSARTPHTTGSISGSITSVD